MKSAMNWSISLPSSSRGRSGDRGFTLVEVLVAIAALMIVLTAIYGTFAAVGSAKQRLDGDSADYHRARVILDRLGRELRGCYPTAEGALVSGTTGEGRLFLELTTTAVSPLSAEGTGIARVRYELTEDPESEAPGLVLLRQETPWHRYVPGTQNPAGAMRLAAGINELSLRFYTAGRWLASWDGERRGLPELVEISLLLEGSGDRQPRFRTAFELPHLVVQ